MGYNHYHRMLKNQVPGEDQQKSQWNFQYYSFGDEPMMLFMFFFVHVSLRKIPAFLVLQLTIF